MSAAAISALERGSRRAPYRSSVDLLADGLGLDGDARDQLHAHAERWRKSRALPVRSEQHAVPPTAKAIPNNLPSHISSFIGRKKELDDLRALIVGCRLLTIVGPGGIGKTRLALRLAEEVLERYPDGVWFVDLSSIRDPEFIAQAIPTAMNIRLVPNVSIDETIIAELSDKKVLLMLDNSEHLLAGVAKIAKAILSRCPTVTLATTSREPLHVVGEQVYRLGSLSDDGPQFFLERAHEADPSMLFGEAEFADVASLCKRLEGIPLAIELACARLSSLSLKHLASRLKSGLTLASKDATETPRHRTLRDTIAWSFDLLSSNEKTTLMKLSVFQGDCTEDAIRAVETTVVDLEDAVDSLVDKSLLQVAGDESAERYRLLDVVREFAYQELRASGALEASEQNYATYYSNLISSGPANAALDRDASNTRAALEWTITHDTRAMAKLIRELALYWRVRGLVVEARSWLARALEATLDSEETRASLLCLSASFATMQDELAESLRLAREALAIYRGKGDRAGAAEAQFRIAEAEHRRGHLDTSEELYQEARYGFAITGNARGEMLCIGNLGMVARQRGDLGKACEQLDDARQRAAELGERRIGSEFTMAMGWVQLAMTDVQQSRSLFEDALADRDQAQDPYGVCSARHGLATVALKEGRTSDARELFVATLEIAKELQLKDYIARALHGIAALEALNANAETAAQFLGLADRLFQESGRELRDSIAYEIAVQSIDATLPEPQRAALLQQGARLRVTDVLTGGS